jgi:hypothetical protein
VLKVSRVIVVAVTQHDAVREGGLLGEDGLGDQVVLVGLVGSGHFIVQHPDLRMESVVPRWRKRKGVIRRISPLAVVTRGSGDQW